MEYVTINQICQIMEETTRLENLRGESTLRVSRFTLVYLRLLCSSELDLELIAERVQPPLRLIALSTRIIHRK